MIKSEIGSMYFISICCSTDVCASLRDLRQLSEYAEEEMSRRPLSPALSLVPQPCDLAMWHESAQVDYNKHISAA